MDSIDIKILNILAEDANVTAAEISGRINLSIPAINKRITKLRASGTIQKTVALTNAKAVGKPVMAYVLLVMEQFSNSGHLLPVVESDPDILECYAITGEYDYILKVCAKDIDAFEDKLLSLKRMGIAKSHTMFALREYKFSPVYLPDELSGHIMKGTP